MTKYLKMGEGWPTIQGYRFLSVAIVRMLPSFHEDGTLKENKEQYTTVVSGLFPVGHTNPDHITIACNPFDWEGSKFESTGEAYKKAQAWAKRLEIPFRHSDETCAEIAAFEELWPKWYAYKRAEEAKRKAKEEEEDKQRMKEGRYYRSDFPNTPAGERAYQNALREAKILEANRKKAK